jgi:hypothetical protein
VLLEKTTHKKPALLGALFNGWGTGQDAWLRQSNGLRWPEKNRKSRSDGMGWDGFDIFIFGKKKPVTQIFYTLIKVD